MTSTDELTRASRRGLSHRVDVWKLIGLAIGLLIAATFLYGLVDAQQLRRDSGVFPTFLALLGLGLLALVALQSVVRLVRRRGEDTFDDHVDLLDESDVEDEGAFDGVETGRVLRAYGSIVAYILATMLVGFHIATPTFVVLYLFLWGGVRSWWKLGATFVSLLLLLLVVYGRFMNTPWPRSLLETTIGTDMQRLLIPYVQPLLDLIGL